MRKEKIQQGKKKEILMIIIGVVMIGLGIHFFLLPNHFSLGGATGMAMVLSKYLPLSTGALLILINIVLFIIGYLVLGRAFGIKTVMAALGLSVFVWLLEQLVPMEKPFIDDPFIQLVAAVLLYGSGVGMVLNNYASTGGSDIFAKIFHKYYGLELGKGCLIVDFIVTVLAGYAYGPRIALYSLVGVILNGLIIDHTIDGLNTSKLCIINTAHPEEVCTFLIQELTRSANVYRAVGAYTKKEKEVVQTVVNNRDYVRLKRFIQNTDPKAFITVTNASETFGWRWRKMD
ncbi:MAG: YitT family protein [Tissierellia bacterium]|nr:YitT family protein [Tissierellia bacterium]